MSCKKTLNFLWVNEAEFQLVASIIHWRASSHFFFRLDHLIKYFYRLFYFTLEIQYRISGAFLSRLRFNAFVHQVVVRYLNCIWYQACITTANHHVILHAHILDWPFITCYQALFRQLRFGSLSNILVASLLLDMWLLTQTAWSSGHLYLAEHSTHRPNWRCSSHRNSSKFRASCYNLFLA